MRAIGVIGFATIGIGLLVVSAGTAAGSAAGSAQADFEVVEVSINVSGALVSPEAFEVKVEYTIRNLGPDGPVDAVVDSTLDIPAGCSLGFGASDPQVTGRQFVTETIGLAVGEETTSAQSWTIGCSAGQYELRATAQTLDASPDYEDPVPSNNFKVATETIQVVSPATPTPGVSPASPTPGVLPDTGGPPSDSGFAHFAVSLALILLIALSGLAIARLILRASRASD
jgi:hypothetical protein